MNFIEPKVSYIEQKSGLEGIYKQIEYVGRSCWMSQNMIKEDSAASFVEKLKNSEHNSPLEHGSVYLKSTNCGFKLIKYQTNPYSRYKSVFEKSELVDDEKQDYYTEYVSTNYRVLVENNWLDDLEYLCEPTEFHTPRITFHFTCQRAISAEYNRHRVNSPMESSSRYCNFSKEKFGQELSICPSNWIIDEANNLAVQKYFRRPKDIDALNSLNLGLVQYCYEVGNGYDIKDMNAVDYWLFANLACEHSYINLIRLGRTPDEARDILPFDLKTELYHTAFLDDWIHFCSLRAYKTERNNPHREAKVLANGVLTILKMLNYIKDEETEETEETDK